MAKQVIKVYASQTKVNYKTRTYSLCPLSKLNKVKPVIIGKYYILTVTLTHI